MKKSINSITKSILALILDSFFVTLLANIVSVKNKLFIINDFSFSYNFSSIIYVYLIYFLFFDITNNGITLGKLFLSVQMPKYSLSLKIKRTFLKILSIILTPVVLIFYFVKGEILHDYLLPKEN